MNNQHKAMKPERLILMAAGLGSRMRPATDKTPKPLIRVNGRRIIDDTLEAAIEAGIKDIVIVRGYKAECFNELLEDYPQIRFIENELYDKGNNVLSMYLVRDLLANAFVAEADLIMRNHVLLQGKFVASNYLGVPCNHTDDWAFNTVTDNEGLRIAEVLRAGGDNVCHMYGLSYWTPEDAAKLKTELEEVVEHRGETDLYFEEVPLSLFASEHNVYVRECSFDDIAELDTFDELVSEDSSWSIEQLLLNYEVWVSFNK